MKYSPAKVLNDVVLLAFTAVGGPSAHIAMMIQLLVEKRGYLSIDRFLELNAFCQLLPGPTSTQTLFAVVYEVLGKRWSLVGFLIWMLPATILAALLGIGLDTFYPFFQPIVSFILLPMAAALIAHAALLLFKKGGKTWRLQLWIAISAFIAFFAPTPLVFPLLIVFFGLIEYLIQPAQKVENETPFRLTGAFWLAIVCLALICGLQFVSNNQLIQFVSINALFGSSIFGGGQVLIPMMLDTYVNDLQWCTEGAFLSGYTGVQALPGPMFAFGSYLGATTFADVAWYIRLGYGFIGSLSVMGPGILLMYVGLPIWQRLQALGSIQRAMPGLVAAAAGLVVAGAAMMLTYVSYSALTVAVLIGSFLVLQFTKIKAPLLIVAGLLAGVVLVWVGVI